MRAVIQRVSKSSVTVDGWVVGSIERGFLVLVGVTHGDTRVEADWLARKIAGLRLFEDEAGKMNLGITDIDGSVLVVSQFTLYGDARKGRRPDFLQAARPEQAEPLITYFVDRLRDLGVTVDTGQFRATMQVSLVNDGPVTLLLDTRDSLRDA
jgi:D-tyrosyl-tRNA(Tyr) deacylase